CIFGTITENTHSLWYRAVLARLCEIMREIKTYLQSHSRIINPKSKKKGSGLKIKKIQNKDFKKGKERKKQDDDENEEDNDQDDEDEDDQDQEPSEDDDIIEDRKEIILNLNQQLCLCIESFHSLVQCCKRCGEDEFLPILLRYSRQFLSYYQANFSLFGALLSLRQLTPSTSSSTQFSKSDSHHKQPENNQLAKEILEERVVQVVQCLQFATKYLQNVCNRDVIPKKQSTKVQKGNRIDLSESLREGGEADRDDELEAAMAEQDEDDEEMQCDKKWRGYLPGIRRELETVVLNSKHFFQSYGLTVSIGTVNQPSIQSSSSFNTSTAKQGTEDGKTDKKQQDSREIGYSSLLDQQRLLLKEKIGEAKARKEEERKQKREERERRKEERKSEIEQKFGKSKSQKEKGSDSEEKQESIDENSNSEGEKKQKIKKFKKKFVVSRDDYDDDELYNNEISTAGEEGTLNQSLKKKRKRDENESGNEQKYENNKGRKRRKVVESDDEEEEDDEGQEDE
ncbi:MAG: hypothetical protein EZS28_019442, partial [Streblomastix strix]